MKRFWYYVAQITTEKWVITYEGYVGHSDGFFPIKAAKLQAVDYAGIPAEEIPTNNDRKIFLPNTCILNQIEVTESEFNAWKIAAKF